MKKLLVFTAIIIAVMIAGMLPATGALACGSSNTTCPTCPDLPTSVVNIAQVSDSSRDCYFVTVISGAGDLDGEYDGWCIDTHRHLPDDRHYVANMLCSYGTLPDGMIGHPENLDLANWLMNQNLIGIEAPGGLGVYTKFDLQMALWTLLDEPLSTSDFPFSDPARVAAMVASAQANGEGFKPGVGGFCIVIIDPVDENGVTNYQVSIILLEVPPCQNENPCHPSCCWVIVYREGNNWCGCRTFDRFNTIFRIPITLCRARGWNQYNSLTMLQVLNTSGNGLSRLARAAVEAYLNAGNPQIDYPLTQKYIIAMVQSAMALGGSAIETLADQLEGYNDACENDQQGGGGSCGGTGIGDGHGFFTVFGRTIRW
jgi:hypothetical protein